MAMSKENLALVVGKMKLPRADGGEHEAAEAAEGPDDARMDKLRLAAHDIRAAIHSDDIDELVEALCDFITIHCGAEG